MLDRLISAVRLTVWEAWDGPLQLIAIESGSAEVPVLPLEPTQVEPGTLWLENVYPGDRETVRAFFDAPDAAVHGRSVDYRLIVAEGELLWVRHWLLHQSEIAGERRWLQGVLLPIPEQKHLEWECLRLSERECNRVGQELHDDLCQVLAGVALMVHTLDQRVTKLAPELSPEVAEIHAQMTCVANRVRAMAHGLFPAQLQYATLRDALNELVQQTGARFPVSFSLRLPRQLPAHSAEQIIHVYRIAQEAVSNAIRHGGATSLRIAVTVQPRVLRLAIEDDGTGFPSTTTQPEGIGLHVMQYRARVLGGTLQLENRLPHGAAVVLTYPTSLTPSASG